MVTDTSRIGDDDRKKLVEYLNAAWQQGYLTEEMYTERAAQAGKAEIAQDVWEVKRDLHNITLPHPVRRVRSGLERVWAIKGLVALLFLCVLTAVGPWEMFAAIHHGENFIPLADKWWETVTVIAGGLGGVILFFGICMELFDNDRNKWTEGK